MHDEAQAQAGAADRKQLGFLMFIYGEKLHRQCQHSGTCTRERERTRAIQKLKLAGSLGIGT